MSAGLIKGKMDLSCLVCWHRPV